MQWIAGALIAMSTLGVEGGFLQNLVPCPRQVQVATGTAIGGLQLTGELLDEFDPAVLPAPAWLDPDSPTIIEVIDWQALPEASKQGLPETCRRLDDDPQAYVLQLGPEGGFITAASRQGLQYGLVTLRQACQLAEDEGQPLPGMTIVDWPETGLRGGHICYHIVREWLPYSAPNYEQLLESLRRLAQLKYNAVLLELEALFPFQHHPDIAAPIAYTPEQIRTIGTTCQALQLELIPLVQCLGHQYYILSHERYRHLRETPDWPQMLATEHPESVSFALELVDEYRALLPELQYFHLGGDEAIQLGQSRAAADKAAKQGKSAVYVDHVAPICRGVLERGLRPLLWNDMLTHHPGALEQLPAQTIIAYWNYQYADWYMGYDLPEFVEAGYEVLAFPAIRCGGGTSHTSVNYSYALGGIADLTEHALADGAAGMIVTNWTKGIPFELTWRGYAYAAWEFWQPGLSRDAFDEAFHAVWYGFDAATAAAVTPVYDHLELLLPYAEDVGHRLRHPLDRYDNSGDPLSERRARHTAPDRRAAVVAQLQQARRQIADATAMLDATMQRIQRNRHEWEMLKLGAHTLDHKAQMGLLFDEVAAWQRGDLVLDATGRAQLRDAIEQLKSEWAMLREATRRRLATTHDPHVALSNATFKFSEAEFEQLQADLRALREHERVAQPAAFPRPGTGETEVQP